jgi:FkbM family methyltransferase
VHNWSQNDEQAAILRYFGRPSSKGRFLDIGAYDGVRLSNTRALLELGWSGVLVEPSAVNLVNLAKTCEAFTDRVRIVQAAVSDHRGLSEFFVDTAPDREWSTTINPELVASGSVIAPRALKTSVATIRIHDLLPFGPFDFVSLDAEWEDLKILRDWFCSMRERQPEFNTTLPRMICVEARNASERTEMRSLMVAEGYSDFHDTHENLLMVRP